MPRSVDRMLGHADELAERFESYRPRPGDEITDVVHALQRSVVARAAAERAIDRAVQDARAAGMSWVFIGEVLGVSGEAARQRYGPPSVGQQLG